MNKKVMKVELHGSTILLSMFPTLKDLASAVDKFKEDNGQEPDEIHIPEYHYRGIPIKTKKFPK